MIWPRRFDIRSDRHVKEHSTERLTVDPFTIGMAQEHDNSGDIVGNSASAERDEFGDTGLDLLQGSLLGGARRVMPSILSEHVGLDAAGGDGVGSDAFGTTIGSKRAGETLDRGLGSSIQSVVRDAQAGRNG